MEDTKDGPLLATARSPLLGAWKKVQKPIAPTFS